MSVKILLEDDDDAMFGDVDEEEEEEDVDMAPPPPGAAAGPAAPVKKEEDASAAAASTAEEPSSEGADKIIGDKVGTVKAAEAMNGQSGGGGAPDEGVPPATATTTPPLTTSATHASTPLLLPTSLPSVSPSPFPHHNSGPTSDRLRNAVARIAADPSRDVEAWGALITEAQSCWRQLVPVLHKLKRSPFKGETGGVTEAEILGKKVDWIEACYGALLHHFPYAVTHYAQLVEILLRLSALTQDEEEQCGPVGGMGFMSMMGSSGENSGGSALSNPTLNTPDQGVAITPASLLMDSAAAGSGTERQILCDAKLDRIFQLCLGVKLDGSPSLHGGIVEGQSIDLEGASSSEGARTIMGGLAQHSMDLWLLYIRKRSWDASRTAASEVAIPVPPPGYTPNLPQQASMLHQQYEESLRSAYRERKEKARDAIMAAYETALDRGAGYAHNNHLVWRRYVNHVKSWTVPANYSAAAAALSRWLPPGCPDPRAMLPPGDPAHDHSTTQKQLPILRSIYQRGVTHPMTGLDQFWQEYEQFERGHSESLGNVLIAEWLPRYQHARSVYLERNRVWTVHELKARRLALPPVGLKVEGSLFAGSDGASAKAPGGIASHGGAGASTLGADDALSEKSEAGGIHGESDTELTSLLEKERSALAKWRRRAAYERTNPERLSASDHAARVRAGYREEACALARHPEVWHEWSSWELLHGSSAASATAASATIGSGGSSGGAGQGAGSTPSAAMIVPVMAGDVKSGGNAVRAVAVLSLGMESLPDCALLAQAQADILEHHLDSIGRGSDNAGSKKDEERERRMVCIKVLEQYVNRSPTTLGFVLLQRYARRHQGVAAARAVFARARRTLRVREEDMMLLDNDRKVTSSLRLSEKKDERGEAKGEVEGGGKIEVSTKQHMVTNRLKPLARHSAILASGNGKQKPQFIANAGYITWHLYAAHAAIEHRLGRNPRVAARIYDLGLRRHRTFLSNPPYVLRYANLLLELGDEENLRSLLTRSVAACEEHEVVVANAGLDPDAAIAVTKRKREMQRPLWDMMLRFEFVLSSHGQCGPGFANEATTVEARRRCALYGPGNEDVVLGGEGPPHDEDDRSLGLGAHKSSLNEQLMRAEGYDVASRIANGMGRMVDLLTVTGAIGCGELDHSPSLDIKMATDTMHTIGGASSDLWGDECAGGPSDVSYVKRLRFQRDSRTRVAASALGLSGLGQIGVPRTSGKLLSSRERSAASAGQVASGSSAVATQNSPDWLRPLILLLPPMPRFGRGSVKPPPHFTEMALSALRAGVLPPIRPDTTSKKNNAFGRKRRRGNDGDSSDEDGGSAVAVCGGYGDQFRARQRSLLSRK